MKCMTHAKSSEPRGDMTSQQHGYETFPPQPWGNMGSLTRDQKPLSHSWVRGGCIQSSFWNTRDISFLP